MGHKRRGHQRPRRRAASAVHQPPQVFARSGPGTQRSVTPVQPMTPAGTLPTNSGGAGFRSFLGSSGATSGGPQRFTSFFFTPFRQPAIPPVAESPRLPQVFRPNVSPMPLVARAGKKKALAKRKAGAQNWRK